jgi:hypothetical protein
MAVNVMWYQKNLKSCAPNAQFIRLNRKNQLLKRKAPIGAGHYPVDGESAPMPTNIENKRKIPDQKLLYVCAKSAKPGVIICNSVIARNRHFQFNTKKQRYCLKYTRWMIWIKPGYDIAQNEKIRRCIAQRRIQ